MDFADRLADQWLSARPSTDVHGMRTTSRVIRFRNELGAALEECHRRNGLHPWGFDVLATLRRLPFPHRATHRELSKQALVSSSAITQRIDRLVKDGFVERVASEHSRREIYVQLTDVGLKTIDGTIEEHAAICSSFILPLDVDEHKEFNRLLKKLLEPLEG